MFGAYGYDLRSILSILSQPPGLNSSKQDKAQAKPRARARDGGQHCTPHLVGQSVGLLWLRRHYCTEGPTRREDNAIRSAAAERERERESLHLCSSVLEVLFGGQAKCHHVLYQISG